MAKRKRLTPTPTGPATSPRADAAALETKLMRRAFGVTGGAPIAQVAGDSAVVAALEEVSQELTSARQEGRLVQSVPLDAIEVDYLVRDRLISDNEDMAALRDSLRKRGQQTPIELVDLGDNAKGDKLYGLISGWRRLTALRQLQLETGDTKFGVVQALLRNPEGAAEAYLAMVEENEIRVGLSYYERARIAAKATEQGVYPTKQIAVRDLFASASRAKRSKIGSFLRVHEALDGSLKFPASLTERLGLSLARALDGPPALQVQMRDCLRKADPSDAAAEQAIIMKMLENSTEKTVSIVPQKKLRKVSQPALDKPQGAEEVAVGVYLQTSGGALRPHYTLSGPRVDSTFRARLEAWLAEDC